MLPPKKKNLKMTPGHHARVFLFTWNGVGVFVNEHEFPSLNTKKPEQLISTLQDLKGDTKKP